MSLALLPATSIRMPAARTMHIETPAGPSTPYAMQADVDAVCQRDGGKPR